MADLNFTPHLRAGAGFSHGGNIYEIKQRYKKDIIDFSANINPLGLPAKIKDAIYNHLNDVLHYPDSEAKQLSSAIADYWRIDERNILLGNGSAELIYLIAGAFRPKVALIIVPTFSEYERALKSVKSRIRFLNLRERDGFSLNLSCLGKTDILFCCNPNNPTGNLILKNIVSVKQLSSKLIVIDEAFMDFLPDQKNRTLIWEAVKTKRMIVVRTFTKFFSLPGLRIGYLIAHKDVIDKLRLHQPPWSVNSLAQTAAEEILKDREYIKKSVEFIKKEKEFLFDEITKIKKLTFYPSVTNFLLIKIKDKDLTSSSLRKKLIPRGILIRDCANFRSLSNKFIRVAVRSHRENLGLIKALKEVI